MIGRGRVFRAAPDWRAATLNVVAGVAVALGQAPLSAWYLAFPALVWALARMARPATAGGAFWAGLLVGAGYFGASLTWIVSPFFIDPWVYGWMAPFAVVLMAFGFGLFWGGAAALAARFPMRPVALAATLAGMEILRGYVLTGFPWALVGHMWHGVPVVQSVALWGATGLTVVTLALAAAPLIWRGWGIALAAAGLAAGFGFGLWQLGQPEAAARMASLRLVQPNAEQHLKWDPDQARVLFQRQLDLTRAGQPADLTIWPETAVPYLLEYSPEVAPIITAASGGAKVAIGIQRVEGDRGWNSLRVLEGDGALVATYDKFHLVPFGEYMPMGDLLQDWFGIGAFAAQVGNGYSAGTGPQVLDLGPDLGRVLPLICYEAVFPQIPRGAPERPDWMLQITNDAWFGTLTGPFQHFEQARMRAVEQGLPLIRVANTGVTAVIDARGRVLDALPFGEAGALDVAQIPGALAITPYARWGEGPAVLAVLLLFAAACWRRRARIA
ncbi:apolipoprotein N-acyltransferase [Pseudorhodobacter sp. MZDSW-24AT]|uniref:apolipoprotein N-acyltransferase n=1 Tax=Pseudorhodobacter sp. MZDSW-24AT TaxID=2052957 RepID=UPI001E4EEF90|nr:apolipoprotein N-acyltransferase [Pseudorhodobacter sp. MZDSW-24AT]